MSRFRTASSFVDAANNGCLASHPRANRRVNGLLVARATVAFSLILAQLIFILTLHVSNCCQERYFAWAPNDYSIDYHIIATVNGRELNGTEILDRYRLSQTGFYEDPVERLESVLRRRELAYGRTDRVAILLVYRLDGRAPSEWSWSNEK